MSGFSSPSYCSCCCFLGCVNHFSWNLMICQQLQSHPPFSGSFKSIMKEEKRLLVIEVLPIHGHMQTPKNSISWNANREERFSLQVGSSFLRLPSVFCSWRESEHVQLQLQEHESSLLFNWETAASITNVLENLGKTVSRVWSKSLDSSLVLMRQKWSAP